MALEMWIVGIKVDDTEHEVVVMATSMDSAIEKAFDELGVDDGFVTYADPT